MNAAAMAHLLKQLTKTDRTAANVRLSMKREFAHHEKSDQGLFARMAVMAQTRSFDLKKCLQYELEPIPWSIATGDASWLVALQRLKSRCLHSLKGTPVEEGPLTAAVIVDAMGLLQSLASPADTFEGVARQIFSILALSLVSPRSRVDLVIDRYPTISIKDIERSHRQKGAWNSLCTNFCATSGKSS